LYRSLAHQLQAGGEPIDFTQCRADIAAYMRKHPHDFEPYLEEGCTDFGAYCETVELSSEWGGQLEIAALAHARKRKVTVYSADAPALTAGEEYDDESPILLAFHRHYFGLGAHYNAVVPK
jgi:OTU domain-containing protein 6